MDKRIQEILEWFVQFAQMDLGNLTPGNRAKLAIEAEEYLLPKQEEFSLSPEWVKDLPQKDTPEFWDLLALLQKIIWQLVSSVAENGDEYETWKRTWEQHRRPSGGFFIWEGKANFVFSHLETFKLSYSPITDDSETYLKLKFYGLLNGLPRFTILRCPEYKRFFVNPSLRHKIFCSSRCMWRFNTAKWRAENKEEFLEGQRGYSKKYYEKKTGMPRKSRKTSREG